MAEHNQHLNNGHSPFRRYEPPTSADTQGGNVSPLMPPLLSPPTGSSTTTSRGTKRRQRQARSRWRQWINTPPAAKDATGRSREKRPTSSPRSPQSPAARPQSESAPRIIDPRPPRNTRARPTHSLPQTAVPVNPVSEVPGAFATNPPTPPRSRGETTRQPRSKVTPLRRQPVWTSPEPPSGNKPRSRSGKPRRPTRKAPRPVLYGIRLLILGTGIAAIVGTVLSSLNPKDAALSGASGDAAAPTAVTRGAEEDLVLTQPLPLADELVAVETDLVALESMTPGLTQSIFFYDLDTGNYIDLNGTETVPAASTVKVPKGYSMENP